jgi:hypothetical protein
MIIWYAFGYRVTTHHPGHICYGSSTAQRKLPHGTANVEQEHELLEYALTSRPSCGTLDMQGINRIILRSQELGEYLEDASHVIDDTDSDQSVIEEWDPTILLETLYNTMYNNDSITFICFLLVFFAVEIILVIIHITSITLVLLLRFYIFSYLNSLL